MSYGNTPGQPGGYGGGYGGAGYGGPGYGGTPGYGAPGYSQGPPPSSHLVWAILTTLFCCLPFGIVSIVYAAQVSSKWNSGDFQGAMDSSNKARTWSIVSAVVGVIAIIVIVIIEVAAAHSATQ